MLSFYILVSLIILIIILTLRKTFSDLVNKKISTDDNIKMTEFAFKRKFFKLNRKVKKQISGLSLVPNYAFIRMYIREH